MHTIRQQIIDLLLERECSVRNISQVLKLREKDVYEHLVHIRQSVAAQGKKLAIVPARCLECGYAFKDRRRVTRPGRCPRCKGEHVQDPTYRVD